MTEQPYTGGNQIRYGAEPHISTKAHDLPLTPENFSLITEISNNPQYKAGTDMYGNKWYSKITGDETKVQFWSQARDGEIFNGGKNSPPKPYNSKTGFSAERAPNSKEK